MVARTASWRRAARIKLKGARSRRDARVMTVKELRSEYDRLTRKLLGMTGQEFAAKAKADQLPESPAVDHLKFLLGAITKS